MASLNLFDTVTAKVTIEYKLPAKLDDLIDIYVRIISIGTSSITMEYELHRHGTSQLLATILSIYAHYDNIKSQSRPVPEEFREMFNKFEEDGDIPSKEIIRRLNFDSLSNKIN
jgi:acyl-CoA thioester hydrolase